MINNVVLIGRLTRDVELRYTPSNQAVATFTLAINLVVILAMIFMAFITIR